MEKTTLYAISVIVFICLIIFAYFYLLPRPSPKPTTLFYDNFNDGDYVDWTIVSGDWRVEKGEFRGEGTGGRAFVYAGDSSWKDYEAEAKVKAFGSDTGWLLPRWRDKDNYYEIVLRKDKLEIWVKNNGTPHLIATPSLSSTIDLFDWHKVKVRTEGYPPTITIWVDGRKEWSGLDNTNRSLSDGAIGLEVFKNPVHFDEVKVYKISP